jgi:hypothetical protein
MTALEFDGRRAAVDTTRTVGMANYIAVHKTVASSAILSETELRGYEDIATNAARHAQEALIKEREALVALSKQREASWTNTVEAQRIRTMEARNNRLANDEKRRQIIDAEEAELQAEQRYRTLVSATEQLAKRDERMRNAYTQLLLQQTIEERHEQIASKAGKSERQGALDKEEARRLREIAEQEVNEKKIMSSRLREEALRTKQANLVQLEAQIAERRQMREEERLEKTHVEVMATAEALAAKLEADQMKLKNRKAAEESIAPYKSPREILQEKRLMATTDPSINTAKEFLETKEAFDQKLADVRASKADRRARLINAAAENLSKVQEAATSKSLDSASSSPRSMFDAMEEENTRRLEAHRKKPHDFSIQITPRQEAERQKRREEEQRMVERIQHLQGLELRFDDEQAAEHREKERRQQQVLVMQAQQKKAGELLAQEEDRQMAEQWRQAQEAERVMFKQLIELQMPVNMNPRLAQRALAPVMSPVSSPSAPSPRKIPASPRK